MQFPGDKRNDGKDQNVKPMEQVEKVKGQNEERGEIEKHEELRVSGVEKDYSNGDGHSKRPNKVIDLNM